MLESEKTQHIAAKIEALESLVIAFRHDFQHYVAHAEKPPVVPQIPILEPKHETSDRALVQVRKNFTADVDSKPTAVNLEQLIAGKGLFVAGLVPVALAAAFFLKIAFDTWIGPLGRVWLGGLLGIVIVTVHSHFYAIPPCKSEGEMMNFVPQVPLDDYLKPADLVNVDSSEITDFVNRRLRDCSPVEAASRVFHFVRDEVSHSWDIQGHRVTRSATDALEYREGICYPKSHLVAALLRARGVPTAICYQRLTLFDDERGGYAVHALNAVFLENTWHRIDARGNKEGISAEFSLDGERLAFPVRPLMDEVDYPTLYAQPHPSIVRTLMSSVNALEMYQKGLPQRLEPEH